MQIENIVRKTLEIKDHHIVSADWEGNLRVRLEVKRSRRSVEQQCESNQPPGSGLSISRHIHHDAVSMSGWSRFASNHPQILVKTLLRIHLILLRHSSASHHGNLHGRTQSRPDMY